MKNLTNEIRGDFKVIKQDIKNKTVTVECVLCGQSKVLPNFFFFLPSKTTCYSCDPSTYWHGNSRKKLYKIWKSMERRCKGGSCERDRRNYKNIELCEAWRIFKNFEEWAIAGGYKEGLSIERKDNYAGYNPENCIWITKSDQARNKKKNIRNTSGVTGVHRNAQYYSATWCEGGKSRSKSFSKNKYGEELAELMAIEYRNHKIDMLRLQGVYYGEKHGL